ncbi:hypothetical protein SUDANB176_04617 [Streptomyces sp. enrichment culture]
MDAGHEDHYVENNCYDPICFRLVPEVASSDYRTDPRTKVNAYAEAKIPVRLIVDREHQRLHVLTDPAGDEYRIHRPHVPGEFVTLPDSVGVRVTTDVTEVLRAGEAKQAPGQS